MKNQDIFSSSFKATPYWWEDWAPTNLDLADPLPSKSSIAIVGAGYTGLSAALELRKHGIDVIVLEKGQLGCGASTRNGGGVSGGVNIGKKLSGRRREYAPGEKERIMGEAAQAYGFVENLIAAQGIACHWQNHGRFVGAWTPEHFKKQAASVKSLNELAMSGSYMVEKKDQRTEIASDIYFGGQIISRSSTIHPSLYYEGLLKLCLQAGVRFFPETEVTALQGREGSWLLKTTKGNVSADQVVIATNGYTGDVTPELKRRIIPIASNVIVTAPLPADLANSLLPKKRMVNDSLRIRSYFRMTPDGTRLLYGGRGKFGWGDVSDNSRALYALMVERLPQLSEVKIDYAWSGNVAFTLDATSHFGKLDGLHYILGCNGSGVAMMTYLGYQAAQKIAGVQEKPSVFDSSIPGSVMYNGNPWFLPYIGTFFKVLDRVDRLACQI